MRTLVEFTSDDKKALIKSDGGSYVVEMYLNNELTDTKLFAEHTLRIVENFAKTWTHNKE